MKKNESLTQDEVTNLRDLNRKTYDTLVQLGDIEAAINRLSHQKKATLIDHETFRLKLKETQNHLKDLYGDKKVDLETGILT